MIINPPEDDSIFGNTIMGVPNPNVPHIHPYPTRYHGPRYGWVDISRIPFRSTPFKVSSCQRKNCMSGFGVFEREAECVDSHMPEELKAEVRRVISSGTAGPQADWIAGNFEDQGYPKAAKCLRNLGKSSVMGFVKDNALLIGGGVFFAAAGGYYLYNKKR